MSKERIEARLGLSGPPLRALPATEPMLPDHELLRRIGQGSYGEVWLARNVAGTHRAIKVVYRDHFQDSRPYEREYAGMLRFEPLSRSNEGFVDILQIGRNEAEGFFYYVMELADDAGMQQKSDPPIPVSDRSDVPDAGHRLDTGRWPLNSRLEPSAYIPRTLATVLSQRHRLPVSESIDLGINLNLALGHLHRHGLIHRDVKPANIIFVGGVPKLADIGLVADIAGANTFVGTEGFIPPEGPNSPQADIYALGKLLYEAVMGKDRQEFPEPFTQMEMEADVEQLLELNAVILKACAPDPRARYKSAEDMNVDLALLQSGRSVRQKHAVERRLRRVTQVGAVAAVLALAAVGAWFFQAHQTREARRLSEENRTLANQSREQLLHLQVANGVRQMNEANPALALLWFAKALPHVTNNPARDSTHRMRVASVVESHPKLLHLFVHDSPVARSEFTPDGQRLVSQTKNNRVSVFDLKTGQLVFSVKGLSNSYVPHASTYAPAAIISSDGRRLILRGLRRRTSTEIRDLTDGHLLQFPGASENLRYRMLDSLDGKRVLVADRENTARIIDLDSGESLSPPMIASTNILSGRMASGSRHVALLTGTPGDDEESSMQLPRSGMQVWDVLSSRPVGPVIPVYQAGHFLVTRDGSRVVTHAPQGMPYFKFRIFDSATGTLIENSLDFSDKISAWVVKGDSQWLAAHTKARGAQLWNPETGELVSLNYEQIVRDVALSPDGLLLGTASDDGTAQIWNVATGMPMFPALSHAQWAYGVAFHPDGHLVATSSEDQTLRVWDLAATRKPELVLRERDRIVEAAISPDGRKIATLTSYACSQRLWDATTGQPIGRPLAEGHPMSDLKYSPDGKRFVSFCGGAKNKALGSLRDLGAYIWDLEATNAPALAIHPSGIVHHAEFSPDSRWVVTAGNDGMAQIWDGQTGEPIGSPLKHGQPAVTYAAFSPDGSRVALATLAGVQLRDAKSGHVLLEIEPTKGWTQVQFSTNGRYLVAGGRHQIAQTWDAASGSPVTSAVWHGGTVQGAKFHPDGNSFLTYGAAPWTIVWNLARGEHAAPVLSPERGGSISGAEFSPDGRFVVSNSEDGTVRVWDSTSGEPAAIPMMHAGGAYSAHFDSTGDRLLTAGHDCTARLWKLPRYRGEASDVGALGELLSGSRLLANGAGTPLSVDEIARRFVRLRAVLPQWFQSATLREQSLWHDEMSEVAKSDHRWEAVIWQVDKALDLDPTLADQPTGDEIFRHRAWARMELGSWSQAAMDHERAVRHSPDKVYNWWDWMISLAVSGQKARYQSACTELLDQFRWLDDAPRSAPSVVHPTVAWSCAFAPNTPENLERALRHATASEAMNPAPDSGEYRNGKIFARAGRYAEAINRLENSRKLFPPDFESLAFLALAYQGVGQNLEARRCLDFADTEFESRVSRGKVKPDEGPNCMDRAIFTMLRQEVRAKLASASP